MNEARDVPEELTAHKPQGGCPLCGGELQTTSLKLEAQEWIGLTSCRSSTTAKFQCTNKKCRARVEARSLEVGLPIAGTNRA